MFSLVENLDSCLRNVTIEVHFGTFHCDYYEFSCLYPRLEPFYLDSEKDYDGAVIGVWMFYRPLIPIVTTLLYVGLIYHGREFMKNRPAWNMKRSMVVWNLFLSLFSGIGFLRTLPHLLHNMSTMSVRDNLCTEPCYTYGHGSTGLWVQLFIVSKFPELVDTFFIIVRKKPLIFLHWYHHITVLLYCWYSYMTMYPPGLFFVVMNYGVHAAMYFYYFLMAAKIRPKWFNPVIITILQISQMIAGVFVTLLGFYFFYTDDDCAIRKENNTGALVMYGSYLLLFLQFFIGRYFKPKVGSVQKSKAKAL